MAHVGGVRMGIILITNIIAKTKRYEFSEEKSSSFRKSKQY
jgi:hypothetical protein